MRSAIIIGSLIIAGAIYDSFGADVSPAYFKIVGAILWAALVWDIVEFLR